MLSAECAHILIQTNVIDHFVIRYYNPLFIHHVFSLPQFHCFFKDF